MDLKSLIDVTSFAKLKDYLHNDPSTSALIQVVDIDLVEAAEYFITDTPQSTWQIRTWIKSGKLIKDPIIPSVLAVEVIRIVPFFIFKNLHKRYE